MPKAVIIVSIETIYIIRILIAFVVALLFCYECSGLKTLKVCGGHEPGMCGNMGKVRSLA